jgi:ArsR family transcriptional regulator
MGRTRRDLTLDELHAKTCKVFTNPARIGLLSLLRDGERSVGDLAKALGTSQPTVSKHLLDMRERGVLTSRREGATVYYRVVNPKAIEAFDLMRQVLLENLREGARLTRRDR